MTIINLTPHDVVVVLATGERKIYPRSGNTIRVAESRTQIGEVDGVPLFKTAYAADCALPQPRSGTYYIVSLLVAQIVNRRADLLVVADTIRDDKGQIVGCRAFATVSSIMT